MVATVFGAAGTVTFHTRIESLPTAARKRWLGENEKLCTGDRALKFDNCFPPAMSQLRIVLSRLPEKKRLPSGAIDKPVTAPVCPLKRFTSTSVNPVSPKRSGDGASSTVLMRSVSSVRVSPADCAAAKRYQCAARPKRADLVQPLSLSPIAHQASPTSCCFL